MKSCLHSNKQKLSQLLDTAPVSNRKSPEVKIFLSVVKDQLSVDGRVFLVAEENRNNWRKSEMDSSAGHPRLTTGTPPPHPTNTISCLSSAACLQHGQVKLEVTSSSRWFIPMWRPRHQTKMTLLSPPSKDFLVVWATAQENANEYDLALHSPTRHVCSDDIIQRHSRPTDSTEEDSPGGNTVTASMCQRTRAGFSLILLLLFKLFTGTLFG